jgi:hypothetical protein
VLYATQTHTARRFHPGTTDDQKRLQIRPGITFHDIRLAILVESEWERLLKASKAVFPPPGTRFPGSEPDSIIYKGRWNLEVKRYTKKK